MQPSACRGPRVTILLAGGEKVPFGLGEGDPWRRSKVLWMNKYQPGRRVIIKLWLGGRNWWSRRGLVQRDFSSFYFFNNFYFNNFDVFELQCSNCFNGSFLNDYFICLRNEWNNNAFMNSIGLIKLSETSIKQRAQKRCLETGGGNTWGVSVQTKIIF